MVWLIEDKRLLEYEEFSVLSCPKCGHTVTERMPTNACQFFYDCKGCGEVLRPNVGDCCVFCSFGTVKCPPIQLNEDCCQTHDNN